MSSMSRRKGNAAEREAAAALRRLGHHATTSRATRGGTQHGADIIAPSLPIALEVKNASRDELPRWIDQARAQATDDTPGAVIHKRRGRPNAEEWFVTMQLDDFIVLLHTMNTEGSKE